MGSGASTADVKQRVDAVEKHCEGKNVGCGTDGLPEMMKCAKELRGAMDAVAESSKPDAALIERIGLVSDTIYHNVDSRITVELVEMEEAETVLKDILELAADLDTVRASPVSKKLEAKWEQMRSQRLDKVVREIAEIVKATTEVAKLLEALQQISAKLDALAAGSVSPEIVKRALVQASGFASAKFLKGFPMFLQKEGPACLGSTRDLVAKFDERCTKLAAAAEGSSWALQLPEVEKLVQQAGFSEAGSAEAGGPTEAGGLAEVPAGSAEAGGTAEAGTAEAGGPAEVPAGSAEAGGLAGSADAGGAAEEAGGLAEPAEAGSAEALAAACGKLEEVETMLAQETGMNPNVILKNLTDIAPLWPSVESPELKDRMVAAFSTLKTRMSAACAAASKEDQEAKLKALIAFAHKMDEAQRSLGCCCSDFLLCLAVAGASQDLLDAETELGKETGMNPMLVLKNIRNLRIYWEVIGSSEEGLAAELRQRLGGMCDLMRSRITSSYEENPEKRPNLLKFSGAFDTAIHGLAGAGEANLASELQAKG